MGLSDIDGTRPILHLTGARLVELLVASALVIMGGVCSAGIAGDKSPTELSFRAMGFVVEQDFRAFSAASNNKTAPVEEAVDPNQVSDQSFRLSEKVSPPSTSGKTRRSVSKEPHLTHAESWKAKAGKPRRSTSGKAGPSKASLSFWIYMCLYNCASKLISSLLGNKCWILH